MAQRVIDVLEVVDVEKRQRNVAASRAGCGRFADQIAQPRPVGQAGQHVEIGKARDLRPRLHALDRERAEMQAGIDDAVMPMARRTGGTEIEREGADHTAVLGLDRRRPAGAQPDFQQPLLERLPARIGVDVERQHRFAVIRRGATRADLRADRHAVERARVIIGQARAAERVQQPLGVDVQDGGDHIRRDLLDETAHPVGDVGDRNLVRECAERQLLQHTQLPGFRDVGQQCEDLRDPALRIAQRFHVGRDPDLVTIVIVNQDLFFAALGIGDPSFQAGDRPAIGVVAGEEIDDIAAFDIRGAVAEQAGERGVGVEQPQIGICNQHRTGGAVSDRGE